MGEYAEYALREAMRNGQRFKPGPVKRRPLTHECPECGKMCRGADAVRAHMKAKHTSVKCEGGE